MPKSIRNSGEPYAEFDISLEPFYDKSRFFTNQYFKNNIITEDQFIEEKENLLENGVDEITLFDNSTRPKMNIMIASAADNCIRNDIELQDYVNGEKVFDLGSTELE